jgi:dCMP deaminase
MDRPSWNDYFKEITLSTLKRSPCERLKVGCILVLDKRIISQGYNGFLPGCPHTSIVRNNHEQATVHAEQNAICDCAKRGVSCNGAVAYISHFPCLICARLLLASGIIKIYYVNDYKNDLLVDILCKQKDVEIEKI